MIGPKERRRRGSMRARVSLTILSSVRVSASRSSDAVATSAAALRSRERAASSSTWAAELAPRERPRSALRIAWTSRSDSTGRHALQGLRHTCEPAVVPSRAIAATTSSTRASGPATAAPRAMYQ